MEEHTARRKQLSNQYFFVIILFTIYFKKTLNKLGNLQTNILYLRTSFLNVSCLNVTESQTTLNRFK